MSIILKNLFTYGEIGSRVDGVRNSDIYQDSARSITNFTITDIGSLKVAKKYNKTALPISGKVLQVLPTAKQYYLILTDTNLYSINNNTNAIINTETHGMGTKTKLSVVGNDKIIILNGSARMKSYKLNDANITVDTFINNLELPVRNKKIVQLDLWKVSRDPVDTSKLRIVQMSSFTNPLIKTQDGKIYLHNSDILINRVYTNYSALVDIKYFTTPKDGEIYGILRTFEKPKDGDTYIVDNTKVTIGQLTKDDAYNGSYFTSITGNGEGVFTYGRLMDNIYSSEFASFYKDRLYLFKEGYFYASKLGEHNDFRNGVNPDEAFFFQLSPINGKSGNIIGLISDYSLYIITSVGIYVLGYSDVAISPSNFGGQIKVVSDIGATDKYCIKDNMLYFINKYGSLKAVVLDRSSQTLLYDTVTVDKFTSLNLFSDIDKLSIEDRDYVACRSKDDKYMYIVDYTVDGLFRKVKLEIDFKGINTFHTFEDKFLINNMLMTPTQNNYSIAKLGINPFYISDNYKNPLNGGMYLFDNSTKIDSITVKMLREGNGIQGLEIHGTKIQNLPAIQDIYGLYRLRTSVNMKNGFEIYVYTNENSDTVELQGIQCEIQVNADK